MIRVSWKQKEEEENKEKWVRCSRLGRVEEEAEEKERKSSSLRGERASSKRQEELLRGRRKRGRSEKMKKK